MKKKLCKLNKKIRHSNKKHNNLISKRNSIKKKIEELKGPREPHEPREPEKSFNPVELEQAFNRAFDKGKIGVIAENKEKYISFNVDVVVVSMSTSWVKLKKRRFNLDLFIV